ncbi:MAG: hypothetical protein HZB62_00245 [Nitrospirae bacterium]|nr:hypothetical protein [Nitrospirota bacterium]
MPLKMRKTCKIFSAFLGSLLILIIMLAYSQYLTLKKTLISRISARATVLIGQKVEINDIFLDPAAGITIAGITVRNPDGFIQGDLLKIKKIRLDMRYKELFKGRFSFRNIDVVSPELSLMTAEGKLNIAEAFGAFFLKKGTAEYLIDGLTIRNAGFSFNNEPLYRIRDMDLSMNGLSSAQGTKISFKAFLAYWESNKMTVEGWAYLNDKAQKFSISARSDDINFSMFREHAAKFGMGLEKSRANISFQAEGDADQGIMIRTEARVKSTGMSIFRKNSMHSLSLTTEAFLDIKKEALTVGKALFSAGDSSTIQATGSIQGIFSRPSYAAEIRVNRLDLSSFDIMKGLKAGGIITSDLIRVKGTLFSVLPEVTGMMTVSNGALSLDKAEIQGMNGKITFTSGKDLSATVKASARIFKAGDAVFKQPVEMDLAAEGKGKPERIILKSELNLSGIDMVINGKNFRIAKFTGAYDGTVQGKVISGKASLQAADLAYDGYQAKNLGSDLAVDYDRSKLTIKNIKAASDLFSAAGEMMTVTLPQGRGKIMMEAKNFSASYPAKKAVLRGFDCNGSLSGGGSSLSCDLGFTARQVSFQDISLGPVSGRGSIANSEFIIDIPSAKLFEGSARIFAKGKAGDSPYPIAAALTAEYINIGQVSQMAKSFFSLPYAASGSAQALSFEGTISSSENAIGKASIRGKNISITDAQKRALVKDAAVSSDLVFHGREMEIRADASVAGLALSLSGTADNIFNDKRTVRMNLIIPETGISDIRTAFWDVVPDRLLYAGLSGSIAANLIATYSSAAISADGGVLLRGIALEGENNEYSLGPINGMVPVHFNSAGNERNSLSIPSFERTDFEDHKKAYASSKQFLGNEIKIGSLRYGFRLLEDVSLWVEQKGSSLKINRFSAKMFGGKVNGTGFADLSDGLSYRAGLITDGVSLTQLCEEIPPIKGYISGKIDGIAAINGSGAGLANITGRADFWTYSGEGEKTRISREFLEKIGGPQVRAYLGERRFNRGIMGLSIQNGFFIFRELEISNRNFAGISDLSVKVAPLNNRIAIDHLMWTITEAAQRAKKE